jgi:acetolactate synthase-1/3 small subunit
MKHVLSLLVENHHGVLSRIARLFDGRGYRLESLTTAPAGEPGLNRITLVASGPAASIDKAAKQLEKLVDVIEVKVALEAAAAE